MQKSYIVYAYICMSNGGGVYECVCTRKYLLFELTCRELVFYV